MDTGKDLTDLLTLDEQGTLMTEENEALAAKPVAAAVLIFDSDALLDVKKRPVVNLKRPLAQTK